MYLAILVQGTHTRTKYTQAMNIGHICHIERLASWWCVSVGALLIDGQWSDKRPANTCTTNRNK